VRLRILHGIHDSIEDVRLDCDSHGAQLRHAVFGWVVRFLDDDTLALGRLGPVFLEHGFAYPFLTRSCE